MVIEKGAIVKQVNDDVQSIVTIYIYIYIYIYSGIEKCLQFTVHDETSKDVAARTDAGKQWRRQLWGTGARAPLDFAS